MRRIQRYSLILLCFLILLFAFSGCGRKEQEVKIGIMVPLSGQLAVYGEGVRDGAILAFDKVNAAGGIDGKRIVPIVVDNKADGAETANALNKLITKDKVVAVVGPVISATANVAGPIAVREGIPLITPTATAIEVTEVGEYVSRTCFLDDFQGSVMARFAVENLQARKAAVIFDLANDYSIGLKNVFAKTFAEYGGEVVEIVSYTTGDSDFNAQLTKIKAANPDVIYLPAYYSDDVLFLRQAKNLGITATFMGADGWDAQELIDGAKEDAEGVYFTTHYTPTDPAEIVQNFLRDYQGKYNKFPIVLAALGYDAAALLAEAIDRADSLDPKDIKEAINSTVDFHGVTGTITLDENRNPVKEITIATVKNGRFELVTKLRPE
ncbi:MAG TPA: ABC transporter substrate-binding protein [Firmicutes bacterium]|nr:ABC transporter substrate-binding protein [Bacillota bacterium]